MTKSPAPTPEGISAEISGQVSEEDFLRLDRQICFSLHAASRAFNGVYRVVLKDLGITYPQYLVLLVLWEQGELPVKKLGEHLRLDSGTLSPLLATPANRLAIFTGRALPFVVNGLVVSAFGFAISWLLLDFRPAEGSVPALALVVAVTTCSCTALGMLIGSIGLRARDVFFGANLVYFLMLLVCGVNVAPDDLPGWLEAIGKCLPLTHGIEAAREIVSGSSLGETHWRQIATIPFEADQQVA